MIRTGPYPTTCCFLRHLLRPAIAAVGLALLALGPVGLAADADAYQRALAAGKARLEAGQLADAQKDFHAALQADSVGYDAYFHLAVVSFRLDDHAAALEYANAAVNAAADDQRPRARELLKAIRDARETEDLAHQADEALGKGLIAKAADLYARAFELAPDRGDLGLKGATLYATRLNRLLEAAVLFQRVIASGDANAATAAGAELGKLHARLTALYREQLPRAVAQGDLPTLAQLSRAFPEEAQPRLEVAVRNAIAGAGQATANWLGEAVTRGTGYDAIQERIVFLDLWEKDEPAFKAFIGDAFGSSAVNDMNRRLKERQDQQALERALAAEKARLEEIGRQNRLREQQLAQEKIDRENAARPLRAQLRQRVVEQLDAFLQGKPVKRIVRTVKDAYYHTVWHDYTARIFLQGDSYVLETRNRAEGYGPKNRHGIWEFVSTSTLPSLQLLGSASVAPHSSTASPKLWGGSYQQLRTLKLAFEKPVASIVRTSYYNSALHETSEPSDQAAVEVDFVLGNPAGTDRIPALVLELQTIDSLTLEQLHAKVGAP